nr:reverse transcriptase domain-containing protein [Tanacetum cinerariifolium]
MPLKRTSTYAAPPVTQSAIKKLVYDSVTAALEAQAATMVNTDNTHRNTGKGEAPVAAIRQLVVDSVATPLETQEAAMANVDNANRNPEPREALIARKCSYKECMSYQPFNFKGSKGAIGLIHWFERIESVFSCSNCIKYCKVKFATGTLIEEALSWWNSFAQPIGIEEAHKITWVEFKKLLIKKYYPQTKIQKMEDEFYHLTMKRNDRKTYVEDSRNWQTYAPLWCHILRNSWKLSLEDYLKVSKEMLPPLNLKL